MKLTHEDYDQLSVFTLKGEFAGEEDAEKFRVKALDRLAHSIRDIVLDLEHTEFIDSRGFEAILWLQDACAEKLGQVRLAVVQDNVNEALRITRLGGRFDCHGDIDSAIKSLR